MYSCSELFICGDSQREVSLKVNTLSRVTVLHVNVPKSITCYEQHVLPLNVLFDTCVQVKRFI